MNRNESKSNLSDSNSSNLIHNSPSAIESIEDILKTNSENSAFLENRESNRLDFKKSFTWASREEYARTMAAFSNTEGGYLVFGVRDNPREIVGLKNDKFDQIDQAIISQYLNDIFSPEIHWEMQRCKVNSKYIGFIYTTKAIKKPIIATKNGDREIREGDIFYRYPGQTKRIRYAELQKIIDDQITEERKYWSDRLAQIANIGAKNTAIFNIETGEVRGSGGSFYLEEALLPQLQFIKEGHFHETEGSPVLKVVGEVKTVKPGLMLPTKTIEKPVNIRTPEIIYAFLDRKEVTEPKEYIKSICFEPSAYLPVYYYISLAKLNLKETLRFIDTIPSRSNSKINLKKRLESEDILEERLDTGSKVSKKKREYRDRILNRRLDCDIPSEELRYVLQSIRTLDACDIDHSYLYPLLKKWFDLYYSNRELKNFADYYRRSICYIDKVINREVING